MQKDERGFIFTIPIILLLLGIGGFLIWGMASISWKGIVAVFAAGIVAMAVAGAVFFKANWNFVMLAMIVALAIVFIMEVTFPVLIGGLIVLFAMWQYKLLSRQPLMFVGLIITGLMVMLLAKAMIMVPLGLM